LEFRNLEEKKRIENINANDVPRMEFEERYFRKYCEIRQKFNIKHKFPKNISAINMSAIDERWAVLLEMNKKYFENNRPLVEKEMNKFFEIIENSFNDDVITNPCYFIRKGNEYLPSKMDKCSEAEKFYKKAIDMEKIFVEFAYYNRAFVKLKERTSQFRNKQIKDYDYKEDAKKDLEECADAIVSFIIPNLQAFHALLMEDKTKNSDPKSDKDSDFTRQITAKIAFYQLLIDSINNAIEIIHKHKEVIVEMQSYEDFYESHKSKSITSEPTRDDLSEMKAKGFIGFLLVEKAPTPYWSITAVLILGTIQVSN
jgi:hypothetical protein